MINKNIAPNGYKAIAAIDGCVGCDFIKTADRLRPDGSPSCCAGLRKDASHVIYVKVVTNGTD